MTDLNISINIDSKTDKFFKRIFNIYMVDTKITLSNLLKLDINNLDNKFSEILNSLMDDEKKYSAEFQNSLNSIKIDQSFIDLLGSTVNNTIRGMTENDLNIFPNNFMDSLINYFDTKAKIVFIKSIKHEMTTTKLSLTEYIKNNENIKEDLHKPNKFVNIQTDYLKTNYLEIIDQYQKSKIPFSYQDFCRDFNINIDKNISIVCSYYSQYMINNFLKNHAYKTISDRPFY